MSNLTRPTIYPFLRYNDAAAAIEWLERAFGFERHFVAEGEDHTIAHAQLAFEGELIMLSSAHDPDPLGLTPPRSDHAGSQGIYVAVDDVDAHHDRAVGAGATILIELADTPYGSREYSAADPEGHVWSFGTYRPEVNG